MLDAMFRTMRHEVLFGETGVNLDAEKLEEHIDIVGESWKELYDFIRKATMDRLDAEVLRKLGASLD